MAHGVELAEIDLRLDDAVGPNERPVHTRVVILAVFFRGPARQYPSPIDVGKGSRDHRTRATRDQERRLGRALAVA
jgi:hypothetical protein